MVPRVAPESTENAFSSSSKYTDRISDTSITVVTAGSSTSDSKQCPPLRTASRVPSRTLSCTARTACSAVDTTRTVSGSGVKRALMPRPTRSG
ncbi:hypothetical protein SVIOM74S_05509 [Streptomyces violarus]